jgi:nucleoside-diphosphate-sugar epimerase
MKGNYSDCATSDDVKAVSAMLDSLRNSVRPQPVYFIHTSGTGIIDDVPNGYGHSSSNVFDDIKDIQQITSWPETHWHRDVDKVVLEAAQALDGEMPKSIIKTTIICPPTVYGTGDGPIRRRSVQIPELIRHSIQRQKVFQVGPGQNVWQHVHVADLADAYVLLIEEAYRDEGRADWSGNGYHFAEAGKHVRFQFSRHLVSWQSAFSN